MESVRRTAVLFGAGASRDAGLPLTSELAETVLRRLSETVEPGKHRPDWLNALNFTYGAMVSHGARDGSNPLDAVNIETLISALRLLRRREDHEAAPFVESWREPVLRAGYARADENTSRRLVEALSQALGIGTQGRPGARQVATGARQAATNVGYYIAEIAEFARNPTRASAYSQADHRVIKELGGILTPKKSVAYLGPLADLAQRQHSGLDVITLNYDLTVETAMLEKSITVDRGVIAWPEHRVSFRQDSTLRLHKVHGSLDWSLSHTGRGAIRIQDLAGTIADEPWVVVGDREKLATHGPTLELMQHAADALERADHLVIAGYGFADDHVNQMIRNWLERDESRTIGLIEPRWTYPDNRTFRGSMQEIYGERLAADHTTRLPNRIQGFEGTTAEYLRESLQFPEVVPESEPTIEVGAVSHDGFAIDVTLILNGSPLKHVHFSPNNGRAEIQVSSKPERVFEGYGGVLQYLREWSIGEQICVRLNVGSLTAAPIVVGVQGYSLTSAITRSFNVESGYDPGGTRT